VAVRQAWRSNRLVWYAVVVGVMGAVGSQILTWVVDLCERAFLHGMAGYTAPALRVLAPEPHFGTWSPWFFPVVVALGGLLSGLLVYTLAPEAEGHGTDAAIEAYHYRGAKVRPAVPAVKIVASALTIGSGGSAGEEGPASQISAGAASVLCQLVRLPVRERHILVLAGMAAGLASIFRAPLGMAIFAAEIVYGGLALEVEALPYTLIAAVVAYALNGLVVGWSPVFYIPPLLRLTHPSELAGYALLGVTAGVLGVILPGVFYRLRDLFRGWSVPRHIKPAIGGLVAGAVAMAFPQVLSTGYGWVQMALTGGYIGHVLLLVAMAKILAISFTIGSGGSGGVFGPVIFIGAMLGGWVAHLMKLWVPGVEIAPAAFIAVGMGALLGGTARVPLSAIIIVAELTGGYGLLVPAMLAVSLSFLVQRALGARLRYPRLYEAQVSSRVESPVHHRRIAQGIFHLLAEGKSLSAFSDVSLPDLNSLLRLERPIRIHRAQGRLFAFEVPSRSPLLVFSPTSLRSSGHDGLVLVAVIRDGEVRSPADVDTFQPLDRLICAGPDKAYDAFMDAFGQPLRQPTD
jgi:CIC family chloride channel protein